MKCPLCGVEGDNRSVGSIYQKLTVGSEIAYSAHNVDGRLVIVKWKIYVDVDKQACRRINHKMLMANVVEPKKMVLYEQWWQGSMEARANYYDKCGFVEEIFGLTPELLEGTTAENSKLDRYMAGPGKKLPMSYLRLWQKRRNAENLVMQGAGGLLTELMDRENKDRNNQGYYSIRYDNDFRACPKLEGINWKEARPSKMLGLTPEEFRLCVKDKWGDQFYEAYRALRRSGTMLKESEIRECKRLGDPEFAFIVQKGMPAMKTVRYLLRQKRKYPKKKGNEASFLLDYWNMAEKVGFDLNRESVRWPQKLKEAHDHAMLQQKYAEEEKLKQGFRDQFQKLDPLAFASDGLLIRPVRDQSELILEGEFLRHCVATYAKRHANGETAIFLIRREEEPEIPFFTLEFDVKQKSVRQNRGMRNCARLPEVKDFEEKWLQWIKNGAKQKPKGENAA